MKKIILIVLVLSIMISMLLAEDIDLEKIMPKKLIYSEIPEDYPKELDELFEFYPQILSEIYNIPSSENYRDKFNLAAKITDKLSEKEKDKLARLIWKARTTIPEYFCEYEVINSPGKSIATLGYVNENSFIDERIHRRMIDHVEAVPGVISINTAIMQRFKDKHPELLVMKGTTTWIRCKIIQSEFIVRQTVKGTQTPQNWVKVEIIEDLSNNLSSDQIIIQVYLLSTNSKDKILKEGDEYLIPIKYLAHNYNFADTVNSKLVNKRNEKFHFSTGRNQCLRISRTDTIILNDLSLLYSNGNFKNYKVTYEEVKKNIEQAILKFENNDIDKGAK